MTSEHATLFDRIVVHLELAGGERDVDIVIGKTAWQAGVIARAERSGRRPG
jgi:hypothetical protein